MTLLHSCTVFCLNYDMSKRTCDTHTHTQHKRILLRSSACIVQTRPWRGSYTAQSMNPHPGTPRNSWITLPIISHVRLREGSSISLYYNMSPNPLLTIKAPKSTPQSVLGACGTPPELSLSLSVSLALSLSLFLSLHPKCQESACARSREWRRNGLWGQGPRSLDKRMVEGSGFRV